MVATFVYICERVSELVCLRCAQMQVARASLSGTSAGGPNVVIAHETWATPLRHNRNPFALTSNVTGNLHLCISGQIELTGPKPGLSVQTQNWSLADLLCGLWLAGWLANHRRARIATLMRATSLVSIESIGRSPLAATAAATKRSGPIIL